METAVLSSQQLWLDYTGDTKTVRYKGRQKWDEFNKLSSDKGRDDDEEKDWLWIPNLYYVKMSHIFLLLFSQHKTNPIDSHHLSQILSVCQTLHIYPKTVKYLTHLTMGSFFLWVRGVLHPYFAHTSKFQASKIILISPDCVWALVHSSWETRK